MREAADDLLAALLAEPQRIGQAVRIASPRRMPDLGRETLYHALKAIHERGGFVTLDGVAEELAGRGVLDDVGGTTRLAELYDRDADPERVPEYARALLNGHGDDGHHEGDDDTVQGAAPAWPAPLGEAAFHGLAGEFVRAVAPHTEADEAALLVQFLAMFGSAVGRDSHFRVEADVHAPQVYVALVGETAKARKGTSQGHARKQVAAADPEWAEHCIAGGLSSGEGLLWAVRDAISKTEPIREKGRVVDYQTVTTDPGVEDKRLLVFEGELASALRVLGRDGNTLSAVLRNLWDAGSCRSLTKNNPARTTGAHVAVLGHVTAEELRRYLDTTEAANGLGNRFLWCCVRRSKLLPEGGNIGTVDFAPLQRRLANVLAKAKQAGELQRDDDARERWREVYPELSRGRPGLSGALTARAEAQVVRLSLVYALLDGDSAIRLPHLEAALELWRYCDESVAYIFGDELGDPVADETLRALRSAPEGMTRTQLRDLHGRHRSQALGRALAKLEEYGLARHEREETGGRPVERWYAVRRDRPSATSQTAEGESANGPARDEEPPPPNDEDAPPEAEEEPAEADAGDPDGFAEGFV